MPARGDTENDGNILVVVTSTSRIVAASNVVVF